MLKYFFAILFFVSIQINFSQVGIGTTTPNAILDISQISNDGILMPKVSLNETDLTNISLSAYDVSTGRADSGLLVYNTNNVAPLKRVLLLEWFNLGKHW